MKFSEFFIKYLICGLIVAGVEIVLFLVGLAGLNFIEKEMEPKEMKNK